MINITQVLSSKEQERKYQKWKAEQKAQGVKFPKIEEKDREEPRPLLSPVLKLGGLALNVHNITSFKINNDLSIKEVQTLNNTIYLPLSACRSKIELSGTFITYAKEVRELEKEIKKRSFLNFSFEKVEHQKILILDYSFEFNNFALNEEGELMSIFVGFSLGGVLK